MSTDKLGGLSDPKDANPEILQICIQVKDCLDKMAKKTYCNITSISYRYQILARTLYYIKVFALTEEGGGDYIHLKVLHDASDKEKKFVLEAIQFHDNCEDPIDPF